MLLSHLPTSTIDQEFIPIEVLLFGGFMLLVIVLIHGAGLGWIVDRYKARLDRLREKQRHPRFATYIFSAAILTMLLLHVSEATIWGIVLYKVRLINNLRDSIYFSANTYTTIGYGKFILPDNWRELGPIMAISGLFTFAWTTGEMFDIVRQQRELVAYLRKKRNRKGHDAHLPQSLGVRAMTEHKEQQKEEVKP
jgi:hypothetical protein